MNKIKMFILKKWFKQTEERSVYLILLGKSELKFHRRKIDQEKRRSFYLKELEQWQEK